MTVTAKIHITHDKLALVPTLRTLDDISIRVITQGTTSPGTTLFPFLIDYDDRDELERAFEDDLTVERYELVSWGDRRGIYYIEHTPETKLISTAVTDVNGFLTYTETKGRGWLVQLLLPDKDALNTVWQYARENDISLNIIDIYGSESMSEESDNSYGLTPEQRAALLTAYEKGYFQEPRDMSLIDVADEMGLSSTAMSGRLRRGMQNLIRATIVESQDEK
ncbi:helix-turn-helix domain-containing protein [Halopelagius fulvigenes]|uniref:Helix-turn-helix domain-containing protein n=1 Tax=Halopelagius fulvigenes TaxID=1198324 RepID=A0ABD5U2F6_9EURY